MSASATASAEYTIQAGKTDPSKTTPASKKVPKTGDADKPFLWLGLILIGTLCLAAAGWHSVSRKRKHH